MLTRYVLADLVRNPRRTLSTIIGVTLGVGLFCGVLFFVDGLSASMTQRAVAPLAIDMQRIVTEPTGATVMMSQSIDPTGPVATGNQATVVLEITNIGDVDANEVIVRSRPTNGLEFVPGSGTIDGTPIEDADDNPFAHGAGQTGYNLDTLAPGTTHRLEYRVEVTTENELDSASVQSTYSSRENLTPIPADQPATIDLRDLAGQFVTVDGVAAAALLSIADLGADTLASRAAHVSGPVKIFGFDDRYATRDRTIDIVDGALSAEGAVVSVGAATELDLTVGDTVTVALPDSSTTEMTVTGIADLSRSRSLFSSRRGGDLETFLYTATSVIVSPSTFADVVQPAFDRAASTQGGRLKSPPIREVDISIDRNRLDADPAAALAQTQRIASDLRDISAGTGDYVLDNISNTLTVADEDAAVAKQLFVFLGVPGGLLAAMLAAYAGTVLADAQRREQATLRIRGARRRDLLRMLAIRTTLITAGGSVGGLISGYAIAVTILGRESLERANPASIATSAAIGTASGFLATGLALYVTGRRSIDREINEDRARLAPRAPLWRRTRIDIVGLAVILATTTLAVRADAFAGAPGSVYFGRSVDLDLALLVLPVLVWIVGSLLAGRVVGQTLTRSSPASTDTLDRPPMSLYRRSVGRRPWAIGNATVIVALIVALATSLAAFTASYDAAKRDDGRYANGADLRITPSPTADPPFSRADAATFETDEVREATPVIYGPSNVILRSARTSDPTNVAAIDPVTFPAVTPLSDVAFTGPTSEPLTAEAAFEAMRAEPTSILLSQDMALFLKVNVGDTLDVLLARATDAQVEIHLQVTGLYERLPGFPDGADALMSIDTYVQAVPIKNPDFFLATADRTNDEGLQRAVTTLQDVIGTDQAQIDTRLTTIATDQSSLAALNIAGLVDLDSAFSLAMTVVTIAIFVFGLLLERRREYITLLAQGLESRTVRLLIALEASTVAIAGSVAGVLVGIGMGAYFVSVLRPLFVLTPPYTVPLGATARPVILVFVATAAATMAASGLINGLEPTELLRDE